MANLVLGVIGAVVVGKVCWEILLKIFGILH